MRTGSGRWKADVAPRLEDRLIAIETAKAKLIGVAVTVSLAASAGGTWVALLIAHH